MNTTNKTSMVLVRIAGSVVGLLAGGLLLCLVVYAVITGTTDADNEDYVLMAVIIYGGLGFLFGAVMGAAVGATVTQRLMKQRSSFWRALLGAVVGTVVPVIGTVAGAVIGSGWKARPADAT